LGWNEVEQGKKRRVAKASDDKVIERSKYHVC